MVAKKTEERKRKLDSPYVLFYIVFVWSISVQCNSLVRPVDWMFFLQVWNSEIFKIQKCIFIIVLRANRKGKNHFIFLSYVCSYMKEGKRKWNLVSFISFLQTEFHSCFVALLFSWFVPFGGWCILIVYFVLLFGHLLLTYILHYLSKKGKRIPFHFLFKVVLSL